MPPFKYNNNLSLFPKHIRRKGRKLNNDSGIWELSNTQISVKLNTVVITMFMRETSFFGLKLSVKNTTALELKCKIFWLYPDQIFTLDIQNVLQTL